MLGHGAAARRGHFQRQGPCGQINVIPARSAVQAAGRGLHTADIDARALSTFMFDADSAAIASDYMEARGKGTPIPAIVDAVLTATTLKVIALPDRAILLVALAGAQSPSVRRGADGQLEGDAYGLEVCFHEKSKKKKLLL